MLKVLLHRGLAWTVFFFKKNSCEDPAETQFFMQKQTLS